MRVLVVHAHPVPESYNRALFEAVTARLEARGHSVDRLDLYGEDFDPRLSADERRGYHTLPDNRTPVAAHVDRLMAAEALVLVYPVWNYGFPAILKGWFDRVFLPGVSFRLENGAVKPSLQHIRRLSVVTTYGGTRLRTMLMGDPPRRIVNRMLRTLIRPGAPVRYHALYDLNNASAEKRQRFLSQAERAMDAF